MPDQYNREDIAVLFGERHTQDTPILPEVWLQFLKNPGQTLDLILTPDRGTTSGVLLHLVYARIQTWHSNYAQNTLWDEPGAPRNRIPVSLNEACVAVKMRFHEVIRLLLPLSRWWQSAGRKLKVPPATSTARVFTVSAQNSMLIEAITRGLEGRRPVFGDYEPSDEFVWLARVTGLVARRRRLSLQQAAAPGIPERPSDVPARELAMGAVELLDGLSIPLTDGPPSPQSAPLYSVSMNRVMDRAVFRSTLSVKADAVKLLFHARCNEICWAVVDVGVDARHPALGERRDGKLLADTDEEIAKENEAAKSENRQPRDRRSRPDLSRVEASYDFTRLRGLLDPDLESLNEGDSDWRPSPQDLRRIRTLKRSLRTGRAVKWEEYADLLLVPHDARYIPPGHPHGTHVAGILAADWRASDGDQQMEEPLEGMCPDIRLYDLRVLTSEGTGSEFTVMAALQFVRHLNSHKDQPVIHGVNLSLSTPHDVVNYACGRTPVCEECERLVGSGVVVVAAAGNAGYRNRLGDLVAAGYQESTITDPGNAECVITVGSTHRFMPHAYGVSYFSSRGPTGDGRYKPDLLAPGEKIKSIVPDGRATVLDGTSMAAPHVSGAAALLMARHVEFIGRPGEVKEILCKTATNLGRERYYQGFGMVDILRAIQSV